MLSSSVLGADASQMKKIFGLKKFEASHERLTSKQKMVMQCDGCFLRSVDHRGKEWPHWLRKGGLGRLHGVGSIRQFTHSHTHTSVYSSSVRSTQLNPL